MITLMDLSVPLYISIYTNFRPFFVSMSISHNVINLNNKLKKNSLKKIKKVTYSN